MTPPGLLGALKGWLRPGPVILVYHRVAALDADPQLLAVSPARFSEQLEILSRTLKPCRLADLGAGADGVAVTFDDGYADNLHQALPALKDHGVPATVFVCSGSVGSAREFWWDDLERLLLSPGALPETLALSVGGRERSWAGIEPGWTRSDQERFKTWSVLAPPPTARHRLYDELCRLLKPLAVDERARLVGELAAWAGKPAEGRPTHRALDREELRGLAAEGLVEIGSHTVDHPVLAGLPAEAQRGQIEDDKRALEAMTGRRVGSFAYPFGGASDYDAAAVRLVKEAGFSLACANFPGRVDGRGDPFQLPRFIVRDWDGPEFARRLDGFRRTAGP